VPHEPQLFMSLSVSTQSVPHVTRGLEHVVVPPVSLVVRASWTPPPSCVTPTG
jgi:hypothetical protein